MVGQISRSQHNIVILIKGYPAGNSFQRIFCFGSSTGTNARDQQHQDQQQRFPHGITVFLSNSYQSVRQTEETSIQYNTDRDLLARFRRFLATGNDAFAAAQKTVTVKHDNPAATAATDLDIRAGTDDCPFA